MSENVVLDDILSQLNSGGASNKVASAPQAPSPSPTSPVNTPKPAAPAGGPQPNTQQNLRDKMRANNGSAGQKVVLEQTKDYQEEGVGSTPSSVIIGDDDVDTDDSDAGKKGINVKIIIGVVIAVLIVGGILVASMVKKSTPEEPPVVEQLPEEELVFVEPVTEMIPTGYTADELNALRGAGLTSYEIETYQNQGVPFITAYNIAKEEFWAWQLANQLPITDMTSEDYTREVSKTWLTLPERHDLEEWHEDGIAYNYSITKNLDYEKVQVHGNQLFLKVYLDDNKHEKWFFLNVTPQEWNLLEDAGNVVVDYSYTTHFKPYTNLFEAEEDIENIFITSARLNIITDEDAAGF